jgi:hypothetical protein
MSQFSLFDLDRPSAPTPAPVVPQLPDTREEAPALGQWLDAVKAHAAAQPDAPAVALEAAPMPAKAARRGKAKREPAPPPVVIENPQLPPLGALAKIDGKWHVWRKDGLIGSVVGWGIIRPPEHSAHLKDTPPRLDKKGWIDEPHPAPQIVHIDGHRLRVEWSEYGFCISRITAEGDRFLRSFPKLAACAVQAAEIARAEPHFVAALAALSAPVEPDDAPEADEIDGGDEIDEPAVALEAAQNPAPAPKADEPSRWYEEGASARPGGLPRRLPGWLCEVYRDTPERVRLWKQAEWLAGWDAADDPAALEALKLPEADAEADALALLAELSPKLTPVDRGRIVRQLTDKLAEPRKPDSYASPKEKKAKRAAKLTRTDVRRAYRSVCPRSFEAVAADAWAVADEIDRLCRSPEPDRDRLHALRCASDELFIEVNGGTRMGVAVYPGPKRLMKALRVRARAEKRWPMWDVEGRFRFQWRGLTLIKETRWGGVHLDTDRHPVGTLCHSETGYRSFSGAGGPLGCSPEESAERQMEAYFQAPTTHGVGMGGKMVRYIPWWISELARHARDAAEHDAKWRAECPAMMPAEERPAYWAEQDAKWRIKLTEARARAARLGIDLNDFVPDLDGPRQAALL